MNVFLTEKPKIVIFVDKDGRPLGHATNIAPDVEVVVTDLAPCFENESLGLPFVSH